MSATAAPPRPQCPQCAAPIVVSGREPFRRCQHCDAALWLDLDRILIHARLAPSLSEQEARARLGSALRAGAATLVWRPFWSFQRGALARFAPADSYLRTELDEAPALAGREQPFAASESATATALPPNIPLAAVLDPSEVESARPRLLHVPFWELGVPGAPLAIDAVEGRIVLAPPEARSGSAPRLPAVAGVLAALFFLATLLPRPAWPLAALALLTWLGAELHARRRTARDGASR